MNRRLPLLALLVSLVTALIPLTAVHADSCLKWDASLKAYVNVCKDVNSVTVGITKGQPTKTGNGTAGTATTVISCVSNCPPSYETIGSCAGVPQAQWTSCTGPATPRGCPVGQAQYDYYQVTTTTRTFIVTFCATPGGPPPPSPPALVQQWLKTFTPEQAIGTIQPGPGIPLPFTLDLFAQTTAPTQQVGTLSQGGVTVRIHIDGARYTWNWGDGLPNTVTTSVGGPYPTGDVTHKYAKPGKYTAVLTVEWHVTYDVVGVANNAAGVDFGYIDQPGQQNFAVNIVEAHAILTS